MFLYIYVDSSCDAKQYIKLHSNINMHIEFLANSPFVLLAPCVVSLTEKWPCLPSQQHLKCSWIEHQKITFTMFYLWLLVLTDYIKPDSSSSLEFYTLYSLVLVLLYIILRDSAIFLKAFWKRKAYMLDDSSGLPLDRRLEG